MPRRKAFLEERSGMMKAGVLKCMPVRLDDFLKAGQGTVWNRRAGIRWLSHPLTIVASPAPRERRRTCRPRRRLSPRVMVVESCESGGTLNYGSTFLIDAAKPCGYRRGYWRRLNRSLRVELIAKARDASV
jgi:hypothetical protein